MNLLLASYLHPNIGDYLSGRVLYIDDAASTMRQAPFAQEELNAIKDVADAVVPITVAETSPAAFRNELDAADCIYVAGGETFRLLYGLKSIGADRLLVDAARSGKPYAGSSAGAIIAGPSVEPASVMDDPTVAPQLTDCSGLNLTEFVIVPHAQGTTGPYPIEVISQTVEKYGKDWKLVLLRDGQALHVSSRGSMLI